MSVQRGVVSRSLCVAGLLVLGACRTQLWPAPMTVPVDSLPPGVDADTPPGLIEILVYRHADPVQVRRPESPTAFPLTFYRKTQRMQSGAWVHVGAGGRAELLWPADGSKMILLDEGVCRIGEPGRGEPDVTLEIVTRAEINLSRGAVIELPGGSLLSGPPDEPTGPYLVQHFYEELIRVFNQSKAPAYLSFRDEQIVLAAGERIDLPLLGAGGSPIDLGGLPAELSGGGLEARAYGVMETIDHPTGLHLRARSPGLVMGHGIVMRLAPGEELTFLGFGPPREPELPVPIVAEPPARSELPPSTGSDARP
jgi:hypothetical protein